MHPMANTLAAVAEASAIEVVDGDAAEFETQGCRYRVERRGERMIHTEFMTDDAGEIVYAQPVEVNYAVGSGTTARTYLIDRGGILFESPITWYVGRQKWDLSPGYEDNPRRRFNRRVSDGCVQCHSGRAAFTGDGTANRFAERPFLEMGIGCERCHGPGRRHVERFQSGDGESEDEIAEGMLIVNPARLDKHSAESVCYQCHMDGKRRILRKGRSYYDFRPGMATEDIWTVFVAAAPFEEDATVPFTSHVEQMHASACFRGSDGQMRCTTCHDPHRSPAPGERAVFYRERCNSCHSDRGCALPIEERQPPPADNSCIHCHMPTAGSSDIPHASQSDHRILRNPQSGPVDIDHPVESEIWSIFDDSEVRLPEWELQRARALALSDQAIEERNPQLMGQAIAALESVLVRDANDVVVLRALGFLYGSTRSQEKSKRLFAAALQIDPHDEVSLKNLGLVAYQTRSLDLARRSYEAFLKLNPWDVTMYGPYVSVLAASGDLQSAVKAAEQGLRLDPTERELRRVAVHLYARLGDRQKSRRHQQILQQIRARLDPWDQQRQERLREQMQQDNPPSP